MSSGSRMITKNFSKKSKNENKVVLNVLLWIISVGASRQLDVTQTYLDVCKKETTCTVNAAAVEIKQPKKFYQPMLARAHNKSLRILVGKIMLTGPLSRNGRFWRPRPLRVSEKGRTTTTRAQSSTKIAKKRESVCHRRKCFNTRDHRSCWQYRIFRRFKRVFEGAADAFIVLYVTDTYRTGRNYLYHGRHGLKC